MNASRAHLKLTIRGVVQGVGFRPFIYRLATEMGLGGFVLNDSGGVRIDADGRRDGLDVFIHRIRAECPAAARIFSMEISFFDFGKEEKLQPRPTTTPAGKPKFEIRQSESQSQQSVSILSDLAICAECKAEILNHTERRFEYPFTNCTRCGPRFTILRAVPYDRPNTSMAKFPLCADCKREYTDVQDRRFHAQPIACVACGPRIEYWDREGKSVLGGTSLSHGLESSPIFSRVSLSLAVQGPLPELHFEKENLVSRANRAALSMTIQDLKNGLVVAVKGLGGFHLLVDAFNEEAVRRLRHQKSRQEKPFALLFPSLASIREHCHVGLLEETLLTGAESPIVLLRKKETSPLPEILAPGNPMLGCMLPYTPLHVLLMEKMGSPVVATSGNLSDEPICIDNEEALEKLSPFVNRFLVHDRPIVRHVDDSIARVTPSAVVLLRRARGYAPLPLQTRKVLPPLLALGSDLKNAIGISRGNEIILSQHIGDLESRESFDAFRRVIDDFRKIFDFRPEAVVTDLHPSFFSTQFAAELGLPHIQVQHHFAHLAAALLDHGLEDQDEDVLGVIWDGTGFGLDGTIWGGEFLVGNASHFRRFAHLRTFPLVGGDQAAQEPRRSALGVLAEIFGADRLPSGALPLKAYSEMELRFLKSVLGKVYSDQRAEFHKGFQRDPCTGPKSFGAISSFAIHTSSAGRLFDAVASFLGLHQKSSFEGQAGMALEFAAMKFDGGAAPLSAPYSFRLQRISEHPDSKPGEQSPFKNGPIVVDWEPMIREILQEIEWNCREGSLEAMPRFALVSIAHRFHETLAEMILEVAKKADLPQIVLSGGVFQNVHLLSRAREKLQAAGFKVISNQRIPPNDGGIAAGQLVAAPHSRDAQANFSSCNEVPSCH